MTKPELTVAMPARNRALYIEQAMQSVLSQSDVELELIVVDDASEDDTAKIVESVQDPRVRLLRNSSAQGIGASHNRIVRESRAPFIAHVDSDDLILPGALFKLLSHIRARPQVGQVHGYTFYIDPQGNVTRESAEDAMDFLLRIRPPAIDYRREMLVQGTVLNALRMYRRSALDQVGGFNEEIEFGVDHEMGLRILGHFEIECMPETLYFTRHHLERTTSKRFSSWRFWWGRVSACRRLERSGQVPFLSDAPLRMYGLLVLGLMDVLRFRRAVNRVRELMRRLQSEVFPELRRRAYRTAQEVLVRWPLPKIGQPYRGERHARSKVGYHLWSFPSVTFIQREIEALERSGLGVAVFADGSADEIPLSSSGSAAVRDTQYVMPRDSGRYVHFRNKFLRRRPLRLLSLFLFVVGRRYGAYKTFREDRHIWKQAIYLAGLMREAQVSRIHSPWADRNAFIAMLAARILGVPFSVQARAHELHRVRGKFALQEIFAAADTVITNAHYNRDFICSYLPESEHDKIRTVYEGIRISDFEPKPNRNSAGGPIWILTVARLVEEKGLPHLLAALAQLRSDGHDFRAIVIGGPEDPLYTAHRVEIMKQWRRLGLEEYVDFRGAQDFAQVLEAYRSSDIFVLPCVIAKNGGRDISPNVLFEAMAMELPVVSTRLSGIPEIVEDGATGLLVPPGDVQALTLALQRLMRDPALRRGFGRNGRKRAEVHFDIGTNIRNYVELFGSSGASDAAV